MAKVAKTKKREPSTPSRAHRRAASPDPASLSVKAPSTKTAEEDYKPWLHNAANPGISKKKKAKPLSSKQKSRQLKAMEKADAVFNKHETKVKDSKKRAGKVDARRMDWEELNEGLGKREGRKTEVKKTEKKGKDGAEKDGALDLKMAETEGDAGGWEDVEDGEAEVEARNTKDEDEVL